MVPNFLGLIEHLKRSIAVILYCLVLNAIDGVTEQDQKLAGRIAEEGRACVIVVNKWDAVEKDSYTIYDYQEQLNSRLAILLNWAENIFVSALTGQRVDKILEVVDRAVEQHRRRVSTAVRLTKYLEESTILAQSPRHAAG